MNVQMELSRVVITELGDHQVILLKEKDGERSFPILIGMNEAMAIDRRLNDRPVGESEITIELAGHFGIPTTLITGDDAVCAEVSEWTEGRIKTAVVKHSLSRYAARCLPLPEARKRIRQAAGLALEQVDRAKPSCAPPPYTLQVRLLDRQIASYAAWMPGVEYDGDCTVVYRNDDFLAVYKALLAIFWIATSRLNP